MNHPRITLRDIAAEAGLHFSTVSLALRDHPRISPPVRKRVKELAEKMGYSPDPVLSALNAYRTGKKPASFKGAVAWMDNWPAHDRLRDQPTFEEYFQGAQHRARELGYEIEEFSLRDKGMTPERASRILNSRGIKGLLLAPQPVYGMELPMHYEWFSTVTFGYSLVPQTFHLVTSHQFHCILLALKEMHKLGYRRIGVFIHEVVNEKVDSSYLSGYWHWVYKNPGMHHPEVGILPKNCRGEQIFRVWFQKEKPDAIITTVAREIMTWLGTMDLEVPRDIGYASLCVSNDSPFTGIYQNGLVIGRAAMDLLAGMLQRGEQGYAETPIRVLVEGNWRAGQTVRQQ